MENQQATNKYRTCATQHIPFTCCKRTEQYLIEAGCQNKSAAHHCIWTSPAAECGMKPSANMCLRMQYVHFYRFLNKANNNESMISYALVLCLFTRRNRKAVALRTASAFVVIAATVTTDSQCKNLHNFIWIRALFPHSYAQDIYNQSIETHCEWHAALAHVANNMQWFGDNGTLLSSHA